MFLLLLLLSSAIVNVLSAPAINFNECKISDEGCVTNAIKAAYPLILESNAEIGSENMDPMFQELIEGNLSILKFKLFNTTTTGFKSCEISSAKFLDEAGEKLQVALLCPTFTLEGLYDINGRLIILPVEGNGDYKIVTRKYSLIVELDINKVTKDDKEYRHIKSFKVKAEPLEIVVFEFRNLFNGQKDLSDAVHKFANGSWKEVANEVQDPVFYTNIKKIIRNANKFLKAAEYEKQ